MRIKDIIPGSYFKSKRSESIKYRLLYLDGRNVETVKYDGGKYIMHIGSYNDAAIFHYCDKNGDFIKPKIQDTFPRIKE